MNTFLLLAYELHRTGKTIRVVRYVFDARVVVFHPAQSEISGWFGACTNDNGFPREAVVSEPVRVVERYWPV